MTHSTHKIAVGVSSEIDSEEAGFQAVSEALRLADLSAEETQWLWLFCASEHDPHAFLNGAKSAGGTQTRIWGGSCMGLISKEGISYQGYEAAAVVFGGGGWVMDSAYVDGIDKDERLAGRALVSALLKIDETRRERALFMLYDSVRACTSPPTLNMATYLLDGMDEVFQGDWPDTVGMGVISDNILARSCVQFSEHGVHTQQATAQTFGGKVRLRTKIVHGYRPISTYHTITAVEGNLVLEIDGQPATQVASAWLSSEDLTQPFTVFPTLGVNRGKKFGPFQPEDYQNRMSLGVDHARQGLYMFEPDLKQGDEFQFMGQHINAQQVETQCTELLDGLEGEPLLVFYIDCGGRVASRLGTEEEEALGLIQSCEGRCPYLGCYSGVEIGRVGESQRPVPLDLTGILCVWELIE